MTKSIKRSVRPSSVDASGRDGLHLEIVKSKRSASVQVEGVMGVDELTDSRIVLISHGGRLTVTGQGLVLGILGRGAAEVFGRVEGVGLSYGKN